MLIKPIILGNSQLFKSLSQNRASVVFRVSLLATLLICPVYSLDLESGFDRSGIAAQQSPDRSFRRVTPGPQVFTDNFVEPESYIVGGGDGFIITVANLPSLTYYGTINQNGDLYIPELGIIPVGKVTLITAIEKIKTHIGITLRNAKQVYVSLAQVKMATIQVCGAVLSPGTYQISGVSRILDAIKIANNGIVPPLDAIDLRNIICRNRDSTVAIDLLGFLQGKIDRENTYIYPGDIIEIHQTNRKIFINGALKSPTSGWIPVKENELYGNLLAKFDLDVSADSTALSLQSGIDSKNRTTVVYSIEELRSLVPQDCDVLTIPVKKSYANVAMVTVKGEIEQPGVYPIVAGRTTADEIISLAGSPRSTAYMADAVVIRRGMGLITKVINEDKTAIETSRSMSAIRPEIGSALSKMTSMNDYAIIPISDAKSIRLEDRDIVMVPRLDQYINISGNVKNPGAYSFVKNAEYTYYISQAGGFTSRADKSNLFAYFRYDDDVSQIRDISRLTPGCIIVVPDNQQFKYLTNAVLPTFSAVATSITVIIAVIGLFAR